MKSILYGHHLNSVTIFYSYLLQQYLKASTNEKTAVLFQ